MSDGDNLQWIATNFIEHDEFLLLNRPKKDDVKAVFLPVQRLIFIR